MKILVTIKSIISPICDVFLSYFIYLNLTLMCTFCQITNLTPYAPLANPLFSPVANH